MGIPFYNEEDNVEEVLNALYSVLKSTSIEYEILAVDNGSIDNTGKILNELNKKIDTLKVLSVSVNGGYGSGIISGLKKGLGEYIGFMCGDNQVEPVSLIDVYNKAKKDKLDLCKVRRVKRHDSFSRIVISFLYNIICPVLFSIKARDINGTPSV